MSSNYENLQANVLRILEPAKLGDRTSKIWDLSLFGLVVLNLIAVALESVPTLQNNYGSWFYNFEIFSVIIFTVEYVSRVWSAPAKRDHENGETGLKARMRYIFSFYGIIDLVAILPFYIQAFFPGLDLRVLRALRLLRILKLNHYNSALDDLFGAILEEKKSFLTTLYIFSVAFVLSFSLIYFVISLLTKEIESLTQRRNIRLGSFFGLIVISNFYWNTGVLSDMRFYAGDIAYHTILPVLTVTVVAFAGTALLTRTTMMEVLKDDYILTARAKGLSQKRIRDRHAARTALLPVVTSFIFTIVTIIDGSVLTETIFSWPGMGQLILDSVLREDIPVAMATFSFIGVFALIAHFLADVSYAFLDPRIRIKSQG